MLHLQPDIPLDAMLYPCIHANPRLFRMYRMFCRIVLSLLRLDLAISLDGDVIVGLEGVNCVFGELGTAMMISTSLEITMRWARSCEVDLEA